MIYKNIVFLFFTLLSIQLYSQEGDKIIFALDDDDILVSEFLSVYNKNIDIVKDEKQKDIENYLESYINYKLKIRQAYDLQMDTLKSYQSELNSYRNQLMAPYLRDDTILEKLVKVTYQRSLKEINASHILVKVLANSSPNDTLKAYTKIIDARNKIIGGEDFENIALLYSEDPSVKDNKGSLGYFSAFDMVFPFENAVYNTLLNEVSQPFKTRFGFHIVKINDIRKSKGEIEASHIMIKGDSKTSIDKINAIYQQLNKGEDFSFLAKTLSEDAFSAKKNGSLGRFGTGKMVKEFEDAAFSLENIDDYSKPFKSQYGWHIIKLDNKFPIESYDNVKEKLKAKVRRGDRSNFINNSIVHKLKEKYTIKTNEKLLRKIGKNNFSFDKESKRKVLSIQDVEYELNDLKKYLNNRPYSNKLFEIFKNKKVLDYYKKNIEYENKDFANIFREYREGLLLFELMQNRIWEKSRDTLALEKYFNDNSGSYKSSKSIQGFIAFSSDNEELKLLREQLKINKSIKSLNAFIKQMKLSNVIIKEGVFKENNELIPSEYKFEKGVSNTYQVKDKFIFINSDRVILEKQEKFADVKGKVINDYQAYLEQEWIKELRTSYKVKINKSVVNSLIKKESK